MYAVLASLNVVEARKTGPFPFEDEALGDGATKRLGVNPKCWPIYLLLLIL